MINKYFIVILIFVLEGISTFCNGQVTFQKMYGGNTILNSGISHQQTFDGGYILAGHTVAFGAGDFDFWLVKVEQDGDVEWSKTYGKINQDGVEYIQQTADSGFIIVGTSNNFGANDILLIKTDQSGNVEWSKAYGGFASDIPHVVKQTNDGGFILAGNTISFGQGVHDYFLIKTNSLGDVIWQKTYGGPADDELRSLLLTADGGYAISGYTDSFGSGTFDYYLIKTDSMGTLLWSKTFGSLETEYCHASIQTSDQGIVLCGYINDNGFGDRVILLIKTDSSGDTLWTKSYLGQDYMEAYSINETFDHGLIITGNIDIPSTSWQNMLLMKTDSIGDVIWSKSYGVNCCNYAYSVQQATDGGFTLLGKTSLPSIQDQRMYFIKTDSLGNSGCFDYNTIVSVLPYQIPVHLPATQYAPSSFQYVNAIVDTSSGAIYYTNCSSVGGWENFHEGNLDVYPNPGTDIINIKFGRDYKNGVLKLFNYSGMNVLSTEVKNESIKLDISKIPVGVYLMEIYTDNSVIHKKIVKIK